MRLTPRRRFAVAMLLSWPRRPALPVRGRYYQRRRTCCRWYRGGYVDCSPTSADDQPTAATPGTLQRGARVGRAGHSCSPLMAGHRLHARALGAAARCAAWPTPSTGSGRPASACGCDAGGPRDETRRLAEAIDAMLDRVAEGYEAQRRFAANASHELRTPLATQRALIEVSLAAALDAGAAASCSRGSCWRPTSATRRSIEGLLVLAETERGARLDGTAAARPDRGGCRRDAAPGGRASAASRSMPARPGRGAPASSRCSSGWSPTSSRTRSSTTTRTAGCASWCTPTAGSPSPTAGRGCRPTRSPGCSSRSAAGRAIGSTTAAASGSASPSPARSWPPTRRHRGAGNPDGGLTVEVALAAGARGRALRSDG